MTNVVLCRVQVANGQTNDVSAVKTGMGDKYLSAVVHFIDEPAVELVESSIISAQSVWHCTEADDAEWYRRDTFEVVGLIDPSGEQPGQPHVLG